DTIVHFFFLLFIKLLILNGGRAKKSGGNNHHQLVLDLGTQDTIKNTTSQSEERTGRVVEDQIAVGHGNITKVLKTTYVKALLTFLLITEEKHIRHQFSNAAQSHSPLKATCYFEVTLHLLRFYSLKHTNWNNAIYTIIVAKISKFPTVLLYALVLPAPFGSLDNLVVILLCSGALFLSISTSTIVMRTTNVFTQWLTMSNWAN
ncbi:hypothetical protein ACJX0J_019236, partial [Zea mays]